MVNIFKGGHSKPMKSGRFYNHIFAIGFFGLVLLVQAAPCSAEEIVKKLTEGNIRTFIEHTTDVTTGNSGDLSTEEIAAYLDKHLDKQARFKSVMRYNIPDMPPQEASMSLDKEGFMTSVQAGAEKTADYENLIEILSIKVASNGKKAFVKTTSTEYATMAVPVETGGSEDVPIEGLSECTQIISLHRGVIQMYSANCVTTINFLEY